MKTIHKKACNLDLQAFLNYIRDTYDFRDFV